MRLFGGVVKGRIFLSKRAYDNVREGSERETRGKLAEVEGLEKKFPAGEPLRNPPPIEEYVAKDGLKKKGGKRTTRSPNGNCSKGRKGGLQCLFVWCQGSELCGR